MKAGDSFNSETGTLTDCIRCHGATKKMGTTMRAMMWVGLLLIVAGIAGLVIENVTFTEKEEVVDLGPLEIQSEEEHTVPIPTIAGIVAVIAGLGLIVASRRSA